MSTPCNCGKCRGDGPPDVPDDVEEERYIIWFEYAVHVDAPNGDVALKRALNALDHKLEEGMTSKDFNPAVVEIE